MRALTALVAGELQLMFPSAGAVTPHIRAGRVKALAVTSAEPSALFPGLPTVAAALPGYESISIYGVFAPAGTPGAIIGKLNAEIVRFLERAGVKLPGEIDPSVRARLMAGVCQIEARQLRAAEAERVGAAEHLVT